MRISMAFGLPRSMPGYPPHAGPLSDFCDSSPSFGMRLSLDSASRRTPWPARSVPISSERLRTYTSSSLDMPDKQ